MRLLLLLNPEHSDPLAVIHLIVNQLIVRCHVGCVMNVTDSLFTL